MQRVIRAVRRDQHCSCGTEVTKCLVPFNETPCSERPYNEIAYNEQTVQQITIQRSMYHATKHHTTKYHDVHLEPSLAFMRRTAPPVRGVPKTRQFPPPRFRVRFWYDARRKEGGQEKTNKGKNKGSFGPWISHQKRKPTRYGCDLPGFRG